MNENYLMQRARIPEKSKQAMTTSTILYKVYANCIDKKQTFAHKMHHFNQEKEPKIEVALFPMNGN